jgi:SpoVK/Ycf46/Vps4 family AAA+-type ATPase
MRGELEILRDRMERYIAGLQGKPEAEMGSENVEAVRESGPSISPPPALVTLSTTFGLSPFERDILLLCAGVELDSSFARLCARAQDNPRLVHPTFSFALALLPGAHWSAITEVSPLRNWNLISVGEGDTLTLSPLLIDMRVLQYLVGLSYEDERLQGFLTPLRIRYELPESHHEIARHIVEMWSKRYQGPAPIIQLSGYGRASKQTIAALSCIQLGLELHMIRSGDIPTQVADQQTLVRLIEREAALSGALLIDCNEVDGTEYDRTVRPFIERLHALEIVASRAPLTTGSRFSVQIEVKPPTIAEQSALWAKVIGREALKVESQIDDVVTQFLFEMPEIEATCADLAASETGRKLHSHALWDACRKQSSPQLEGLAQTLETFATWKDIVLPKPQLEILHTVVLQCKERRKVYVDWGFAEKSTRGLGISALFAGPSGTGKTMGAEILANDLRLDLYRIDLSQVVSKYIGETEKNLRRVFDAAEASSAVLLFDEADALFGKRSQVKDSHDRYANIEISYLLQRMEAYRGLAILTTNMQEAIDPAFLRRIRFIIHFPIPDQTQRLEIWKRIFPSDTPTEALDFNKLARLNMVGGNIRNIAMNAAFLAAHDKTPVQMKHLLSATRAEFAKLEKPLPTTEIADWS